MEHFKILGDGEKRREIDKSGMLELVLKMPEQISEAVELSKKVLAPKSKKIKQIVVAGMGGSAIAGNIIAELFKYDNQVPIYVNRDYRLPAFIGKNTLFFALSYSGNTEETLNATQEAEKRSASIICITSGGKLKELAGKHKYPLCLIPTGYPPRAALPFLLFPLLIYLEKTGIISGISKDVEEAVLLLKKLKKDYGPDCPVRSSPPQQLARKLLGKIPFIFATSGTTAAVALRMKTQFSENGKKTALLNLFPELDHNEIVNLSVLKRESHNFCLINLRDEKDPEKIKKRMEITKSLIGTQVGGINEVWSKGKSALARVLSLIYFADLLSVYVAILQGIDPTPIEVITRLKKELKR